MDLLARSGKYENEKEQTALDAWNAGLVTDTVSTRAKSSMSKMLEDLASSML